MTAPASARKRRAYAPRLSQDERRTQLLDAALRLIAREGYAGVTVESVAAEAGVTKPVVYGIYPRLPHLLKELLDRTQQQAVSQLLAAIPHASPAQPGEITRAWAAMLRADPQTWAPILLVGAQTPPVVIERIEIGRHVVREAIARALPGTRSKAQARRNQLTAEALVAVAEHFGRRLLQEPDTVNDADLAALVDDLVIGATRARD